jgi:hypothetical protein
MLFMLTEAGVGAGLVPTGRRQRQLARALFMAVHLANTFLLLGAMTDRPLARRRSVGMSLEHRGGRATIVACWRWVCWWSGERRCRHARRHARPPRWPTRSGRSVARHMS